MRTKFQNPWTADVQREVFQFDHAVFGSPYSEEYTATNDGEVTKDWPQNISIHRFSRTTLDQRKSLRKEDTHSSSDSNYAPKIEGDYDPVAYQNAVDLINAYKTKSNSELSGMLFSALQGGINEIGRNSVLAFLNK